MGYTIVSGRYESGTKEQQMGYAQLFGSEAIQEKFDLYFHWFNVVHELGHILLVSESINMDKVDEELFVNCFAVAYWRKADRGNNLEKLGLMINNILRGIPSPIPEDTSFKEFFKGIWGTEQMNTVMMYGFFQISCVAEAINSNRALEDLLKEIGYKNIDVSLIKPYSEGANSENTVKVLNQCISNLSDLGIKLSDVEVELVDNPEVQCCRKC